MRPSVSAMMWHRSAEMVQYVLSRAAPFTFGTPHILAPMAYSFRYAVFRESSQRAFLGAASVERTSFILNQRSTTSYRVNSESVTACGRVIANRAPHLFLSERAFSNRSEPESMLIPMGMS